jgi:hypothetical protein
VSPKKTPAQPDTVKTTLRLPADLWRQARIRALDERTDYQAIVARALKAYLAAKGGR